MKKNMMMRLASVLLIAVLMSTCAISGTFAKYVTSAEGSDSARVAKWGITMSNNGANTFIDNYDTGLIANEVIVAPGTAHSTTYEVDGTPETDYNITFDYSVTEEVFLKAGNYAYGDPYISDMDFTLGSDYYPVKYTVAVSANAGTITNNAAHANYDTLDAALAAIKNMSVFYEAGVTCDLVITLSWAWAFEGQNDQADTVLGDLAALNYAGLTDGTDYNLDIAYTLKMIATQVD